MSATPERNSNLSTSVAIMARFDRTETVSTQDFAHFLPLQEVTIKAVLRHFVASGVLIEIAPDCFARRTPKWQVFKLLSGIELDKSEVQKIVGVEIDAKYEVARLHSERLIKALRTGKFFAPKLGSDFEDEI